MAIQETKSTVNDKVRLQVGLCRAVAADLERHSRELDRSQSWLGSFAVRCALDDIPSFVRWIENRLKNVTSHQMWKSATGANSEIRLQLRLESETALRLELAAITLNQSPLKLAGLMIEHTLDDSRLSLAMLKTPVGKWLRKQFRGKDDEAFEAEVSNTADGHRGE